MGFPCPHCGGEIVVSPGSSPFPGWRNPPQSYGATQTAMEGAIRHPAQVAHGSKTLTKDGRQPYNQDYPADFLEFWEIYPRHRDKRKALKAWRNAIRRATAIEINAGAIRYRKDPNRLDEFTKYAEGWLNGDGWEDEPLPTRLEHGRKSTIQSFLAEEGSTDG